MVSDCDLTVAKLSQVAITTFFLHSTATNLPIFNAMPTSSASAAPRCRRSPGARPHANPRIAEPIAAAKFRSAAAGGGAGSPVAPAPPRAKRSPPAPRRARWHWPSSIYAWSFPGAMAPRFPILAPSSRRVAAANPTISLTSHRNASRRMERVRARIHPSRRPRKRARPPQGWGLWQLAMSPNLTHLQQVSFVKRS